MHGMLKSMVAGNTKKQQDVERIRAIKTDGRIFMLRSVAPCPTPSPVRILIWFFQPILPS
jgi:hypothetical protein